jgi:hypothetical protein
VRCNHAGQDERAGGRRDCGGPNQDQDEQANRRPRLEHRSSRRTRAFAMLQQREFEAPENDKALQYLRRFDVHGDDRVMCSAPRRYDASDIYYRDARKRAGIRIS